MKRAAIQIGMLAALLMLVCVASRALMGNAYTALVPAPGQRAGAPAESVRVEAETPGVVKFGEPQIMGGYMRLPVRPQKRGQTYVNIHYDESDTSTDLRVGWFGTVYNRADGSFTGDSVVMAAFTAFCLAVAVIMMRVYRQAKGPDFYAYSTLYAAGFSLFALLTGLMMLFVTLRHFLKPYEFNMLSAYSAISGASFSFLAITAPLMLAFAAAMAISNAALLRHERFRINNVLGIGIGVVLLAGLALAFWLFRRDFKGSEWQWRVHSTLQNVYATAFAYFECMLIGAIVCGLKAARHVPEPGVDYILILGCRFRRDGTLTPLLQGRVDRAVDFWRQQVRDTGREAVLMPSGGQGEDEPMAEAEAMRRYLLEQGIPERCIQVEDRSRNTYQNMAYSRALIEARGGGARVAYATTNYHVFRSGLWANLAGLRAEGMGSRTKWWYWPNAFMRECAGLLLNRFRQEIVLMAAMIAFFGALSMALI